MYDFPRTVGEITPEWIAGVGCKTIFWLITRQCEINSTVAAIHRLIEIDPISQDGPSRPEECDRVRENAEPGGGRPNVRSGPSLRKTLRT